MWPWLLIGFTLGAMWVALVSVLVASWFYERGKRDAYPDAEAIALLQRCQPCGPIPLRRIVAEYLERVSQ